MLARRVATVLLAVLAASDPVGRIVRSSDDRFLGLLRDGCRRSPTFRGEVASVERLHGIVYVARGRCGPGAAGQLAACLLHVVVTAGDGTRILRVVTGDVARDRWIALVGHELHHATEALTDPAVVDGGSMTVRFQSLDPEWSSKTLGQYETRAAQDVEARIARELQAKR